MTTFEAFMKIAALLAKGNVKESLEYYNEPTESAPPLSECTHYFEQLLVYADPRTAPARGANRALPDIEPHLAGLKPHLKQEPVRNITGSFQVDQPVA